MIYVFVTLGNKCKKGEEDPRLGEGSSTPGAAEEEGRANTPRGRVKGNSDGEDSTSGTCRRHREKEVAQNKAQRGQEGRGRDDIVFRKKKPVFRYRLHMAAITRTGAGEVEGEDGEWEVERLLDIAATVSSLLSQEESDVGGW